MRGVFLPLASHFIRLLERHSTPPVPRPKTPARLIIISTTFTVERPKEKES